MHLVTYLQDARKINGSKITDYTVNIKGTEFIINTSKSFLARLLILNAIYKQSLKLQIRPLPQMGRTTIIMKM